jgi:uncharacterized repeat protein (TIGR02543 family)
MRKQSSKGISIRFKLRAAGLIVPIALMGMSIPPSIAGAANPHVVPFITVTFYENDNLSDSVSTFQINSMGQSEDLTAFGNLNTTFSNPGYTFTGWNTVQNGTGTPYADGASYSFDSTISLYAQWSAVPVTQTVTFFENDASNDTVSAYQIGSSSADLTLFGNLNTTFSNPGYTFTGWNTVQSGAGTAYANGALYPFDSSVSLYAQWSPLPTPIITFNINGGTGNESPLSDPSGTSVSLPSGTGLTLSGYTFAGWNTAANGLGTQYAAAQSFDVTSTETLYAQWTPVPSGSSPPSSSPSGSSNPPTTTTTTTATPISAVTVSFVANGGSGSLAAIDETSGVNVALPSSSSVVRVGFTLTSWNTEADGKGASYKPGASVDLQSSVTLYAQWTSTGTAPVLYGAIGDFAKNSTTLSTSLKHQVHKLATVMKAKRYTKVKLYGYAAATGLATLDRSLSDVRASRVASYLRVELRSMKVTGVSIEASGEGSLAGKTSSLYSRVEVFVS